MNPVSAFCRNGFNLKIEPSRELDVTRAVCLAADDTECGAGLAPGCARTAEVHVPIQVIGACLKGEFQPFPYVEGAPNTYVLVVGSGIAQSKDIRPCSI